MSDINPRELCDKCAANYAKCLNVGNNRYYICKECLRKQFPQETMAHKPMSKEELIQQWQMAYEHEDELGRLGINTGDAEQLALAHGALKMYDHLQREIDELRLWFANRLWAVGNSAKNDEISYLVSGRQGGHRAWRELQEEAAKILETNAAATRVMEK